MTSAPEWLSRLPVGSSARMSAGSVTSARATATRCCWPPDSSVGSWSDAIAESEALERGPRARGAFAARHALVEERGRDVVEGARSRQEVVGLEDEADRPASEPSEAVVIEVADGRSREQCTRRRSGDRGSR